MVVLHDLCQAAWLTDIYKLGSQSFLAKLAQLAAWLAASFNTFLHMCIAFAFVMALRLSKLGQSHGLQRFHRWVTNWLAMHETQRGISYPCLLLAFSRLTRDSSFVETWSELLILTCTKSIWLQPLFVNRGELTWCKQQ